MKKCISLILFLFLTIKVFPQGTVKGFIYDAETNEPVIYAPVYIKESNIGTITDINGYYVINKIPKGIYNIKINCIGYDTANFTIEIKNNDIITKNIKLKKSVVVLQEININSSKQQKTNDTRTSLTTITPKELKSIPTIGGSPDIAQYLQIVPGIVSTGDQGGQIFIRGGEPIQNKNILDGMILYNPFHSIGLFSVFDADVIQSVNVSTGGFNAEYGGSVSSVMDIKTRDGNPQRISSKISINTFFSKILLEGPIVKQKDSSLYSISYIISFKKSYLENTQKFFYPYINKNLLPYKFSDLYAKISTVANNGSKISIYGFNFDDKANYNNTFIKWNEKGWGTNFIVTPSSMQIKMEGSFAYSSYIINSIEENYPKESSIKGFNTNMSFSSYSGNHLLKYGFEILGFKTNINFYNSLNRLIDQTDNSSEFDFFVKDKVKTGLFVVEPGLHTHYYASLGNISIEPRFSFKYNLNENIRLKLASGLYSQNLLSVASNKEIINLFSGFVSSPENVKETLKNKDIKNHLQKSKHIIIGFDYDIFKNINIDVEGFYKFFNNLIVANYYKMYDDNISNYDIPEIQKKSFIPEQGRTWGIDATIKFSKKLINMYLSYSYSYSRRNNDVETYYPASDRRHSVNLLTNITISKKYNYYADIRWVFGTGLPFTKIIGYYEKLSLDNNYSLGYLSENGQIGILYGKTNNGRLPAYHRLDMSIRKTFKFKNNSSMDINFAVTNLYNKKNIFYYNKLTNEIVYQLPAMPQLGINYNF